MGRIKSLFLVFLVALSLFLSYKLIFDKPALVANVIDVDESEVICYKRLYTINPNRELLREIPNKEMNQLLVDSLKDASPKRIADKLELNAIKDEGYMVMSAFDVPVGMLFACFKEKLPKLDFESFDKFFISKDQKIFLETDKGVFEFAAKNDFKIDLAENERYVELDDDFMPQKIVAVQSSVDLVNPVESYAADDRLQIANGFLKNESAEIREEDSYLFTNADESLRIYQNGDIHYLSVAPQNEGKQNLHETLMALRDFVKRVPVSFSNYRIISLYESDESTLIYLANANLPFYISNGMPITVNISAGKVTSFYYSSQYINTTDYAYEVIDANIYTRAIRDKADPILIYKKDTFDSKRAVLSTLATR